MTAQTFTIKSLAERWLCSPDIIYDMVRKGELKTFRVGRAIRITGAEVDRYETQN